MLTNNHLPGIFLTEEVQTISVDNGVYSGIIYLIVGSSRLGPINKPVFISTKKQFINIFGDIDLFLERKESYFHRTALKLLETGPIWAMNIVNFDDSHLLHYVNLSTSTSISNKNISSTIVDNLYNKNNFWKIDRSDIISFTNKAYSDDNQLLKIVNYKNTPITLFLFKNNTNSFKIPLEDVYDSNNFPTHLHPKDFLSDYMINVVAIVGDWSNYTNLSVLPEFKAYFNIHGLIKSKINDFLNHPNVNVVNSWTVSLLDDQDLYIEDVINEKTDEHGLYVVFDNEKFIDDIRNGLVDLIGYNLIEEKTPSLNFLSYKYHFTDFVHLNESDLGELGNVWGGSSLLIALGRSSKYTEGYVHDVTLKSADGLLQELVSTTSNNFVQVFDEFNLSSYGVIQDTIVDLSNPSTILLELDKLLNDMQQLILTVVLTKTGVKYIISDTYNIIDTFDKPSIDPTVEIVLGYYVIKNIGGEYVINLNGVTIDNNGWIEPFTTSNDSNKIQFDDSVANYQLKMIFPNTANIINGNYLQNRIWYLWNNLSNRLTPNQSLILSLDNSSVDTYGTKELIVDVSEDIENSDRSIQITIDNQTKTIKNLGYEPYTNTSGGKNISYKEIAIYDKDIEFTIQDETKAQTQSKPYASGMGVVGNDSFLYQSFYNGTISTGDRSFRYINNEYNVKFYSNGVIQFETTPNDYLNRTNPYIDKIMIYGSEWNDKIFKVLSYNVVNYTSYDVVSLFVSESVVDEEINTIEVYDANEEVYLKLFYINNILMVEYVSPEILGIVPESLDAFIEEISKPHTSKIERTLEIENIINDFKFTVDYERYASFIKQGHFILSNVDITEDGVQRGMTRVLSVHPLDTSNKYLVVETDSPYLIKEFLTFDGKVVDLQTDWYVSVDDVVETLTGFHLKGFKIDNSILPDGSEERLASILDVINESSKMGKLLADENVIQYRYIVDTYGLGFDPNTKLPLAKICMKHHTFGFLNTPSAKSFKKNSNISFLDNGLLSVDKIVNGGDKLSDASYKYNLIRDDSASYISYFYPYVKVSSNNRPLFLPPAMFAADIYTRQKFKSNNANAWDIVAGSNSYLNDIIDLETSLNSDDMNQLFLYGINTFTNDTNKRFYIYSESTALNNNSTLSLIHSREILIEIEFRLIKMLSKFQWKYNTVINRSLIQQLADKILNQFRSKHAVYDFLNVVNESNNTNEIIDNNIGVLDTYVEIVRGMQRINLNIKVLPNGSLQTDLSFV